MLPLINLMKLLHKSREDEYVGVQQEFKKSIIQNEEQALKENTLSSGKEVKKDDEVPKYLAKV